MINKNQFFKLNNSIFGDDLDKSLRKEQSTKCIELYIKMALRTSHISNLVEPCSIAWLINMLNLGDNSTSVSTTKKRLQALVQSGLIVTSKDVTKINKSEFFTVEIVASENDTFVKLFDYDHKVMELLDTSEMVSYYYIRNYYNDKFDKAWFTMDKMSTDLGMGKATIKKVIDKLEYIGLIKVDNINTYLSDGAGGIKRSNNTYKILEVPNDLEARINKCNENEVVTVFRLGQSTPATDESSIVKQVFDWELTEEFDQEHELVEELFSENFVYTEEEYQKFDKELHLSEDYYSYYRGSVENKTQ